MPPPLPPPVRLLPLPVVAAAEEGARGQPDHSAQKEGLEVCLFFDESRHSLYLANCGVIRYFFLAVVDVQANYLTGRAFQYTSLIGVQVSSESNRF